MYYVIHAFYSILHVVYKLVNLTVADSRHPLKLSRLIVAPIDSQWN